MDIKPCPFCGETDTFVCEGTSFRWRVVECQAREALGPEVRIQTSGKGTREQWEEAAEIAAYAQWNTRATPSEET